MILQLLREIREHLAEDFDPVTYGGAAVICTVMLVLHYGLGVLDWAINVPRPLVEVLPFIALYLVPYGAVVALLVLRGARPEGGFYWRAALAMAALGVLEWWPYHADLMARVLPVMKPLVGGLVWNLKSCAIYLVPVVFVWALADRGREDGFYGWSFRRMDFRPFSGVAATLVLVALVASFIPQFTAYYPSYAPGDGERWLGIPPSLGFALYSVAYGLQFACVETFFRGFLVLGLGRFLGRQAVLPMVVAYCMLHIGKPFGEALTSIFGGYMLGALAYRHRCILEGILLHLALAWSMDGFAWLQTR